MNKIGLSVLANRLFQLFSTLVLTSFLVLPGCGGGSNEDASGLYKSGTGTLGGISSLTDITGFVHDNRIMAFSVAANTLLDGTITSISGSNFSATVDIYVDGVLDTGNVSVSGVVNNGSSISGTLGGGGGDFSLTFDSLYGRGATVARMVVETPNDWVGGAATSATSTKITSPADLTFTGATSSPSGCDYTGTKSIPDPNINIYLLKMDSDEGILCDHIGTGYTGFFTVVDDVTQDDTLLFAAVNGTYANFSVMQSTPP